MKARLLTTVALTAAVSILVSACGDDGSPAGDGGERKAALVIAQGGLGDESYNDLAYAGFQKALKDNNLSGSPIESKDVAAQGEQVLRRAADSGFGLVVDLEFSHGEVLPTVAADYPDVNWALVNVEVPGENVLSILFQEHEGSYLAGALAAMMTTVTGNPKINPDKKIGVIGGTKSVGIDKFIAGYIQGAKDVDSSVEVLVSYSNTFGDPTAGKRLAESMYQQGADIVFHVAGGTGAGVIQAAEATNHYAIGVDTDQDKLAPGYVLTSMLKRTDLAVERAVEAFAKGTFKGGQTMKLGLADGGVSLSDFTYTKNDVPAEVMSRLDELKSKITSGELKVWDVVSQGYPTWFKS